MMFYKYRLDSEYTEQLFTTTRVWLSTPAQLNDPFEGSLQEIAGEWIAAKVKEMKEAHLAGFIHSAVMALGDRLPFFGLSRDEIRPLLESLSALTDFDERYLGFRRFMTERMGNPPSDPAAIFPRLENQLQEVGIFSMSEVPDHPLMWAHYTDDHKGICIGFETTGAGRLTQPEHCLKVVYTDTLPKMEIGFRQEIAFALDERGRLKSTSRIAFSDPAVQAAISTKSTHWSYEREWRYVEALGGEYPWPGQLAEVVFGLRCPPERREHYSRLVSECVPNQVRFFEIRKVANSNSLERIPVASAPTSTPLRRKGSTRGGLPVAQEGVAREGLERKVETLIERGQVQEGLEILDRGLGKWPDDAPLWHLKGTTFGLLGRHEEALACFDRCSALHPEVATGWYHRGVALSAIGRRLDAIESYQRAGALDPNDASTALNIGIELFREGRLEQALPHLLNAKRLGHPRAEDVLRYLQEGDAQG